MVALVLFVAAVVMEAVTSAVSALLEVPTPGVIRTPGVLGPGAGAPRRRLLEHVPFREVAIKHPSHVSDV